MPGKQQVVGLTAPATTVSASRPSTRVTTGNVLPQLGGLRGRLRDIRGPVNVASPTIAATNPSFVRGGSGAQQSVAGLPTTQFVPGVRAQQVVGEPSVSDTSSTIQNPFLTALRSLRTDTGPTTTKRSSRNIVASRINPRDSRTTRAAPRRAPRDTMTTRATDVFSAALSRRRTASPSPNTPIALRSQIAAIRQNF